MQLASLVDSELIFPNLPAFDASTVLRAVSERIAAGGYVSSAGELYEALWEREQLGSTGIGHGIAVPHCKLPGLAKVVMAVSHTPKPIEFGAVDQQPVRLFFTVVSPESDPAAHLKCLAAISGWIQKSKAVDDLLGLSATDDMYQMLTRRF